MSIIFGNLVRPTGVLPLIIGVGPLGSIVRSQHLNLNDSGQVYSVFNGAITHYGAGLPFDTNGRLVVTSNAVDRIDQGVPFATNGGMVIEDTDTAIIDHINQGVPYTVTSAIITS